MDALICATLHVMNRCSLDHHGYYSSHLSTGAAGAGYLVHPCCTSTVQYSTVQYNSTAFFVERSEPAQKNFGVSNTTYSTYTTYTINSTNLLNVMTTYLVHTLPYLTLPYEGIQVVIRLEYENGQVVVTDRLGDD